jgi:hypothetical protein
MAVIRRTRSLVEPVATPQHFVPAPSRELRAQAVQRLQLGVFGLTAMLLLVGLANIIMDRARLVDGAAVLASRGASSGNTSTDPLADIGVVPSSDPSAGAKAHTAPRPGH